MIALDVVQGSEQWIDARVGLPTASQFHRILTPKTMQISASADTYLCELLAEWMLGTSLSEDITQFMQRGQELEHSAIALYELQRGCDTSPVGFLLRDDRSAGCSPDRLVGQDGGLEIKCPSPAVHVSYMLMAQGQPPAKHLPQIQGCLWITERKWWDFASFHPTLPPVLVRVERDEAFIAALEGAMNNFTARLDGLKAQFTEMGYGPAERELLAALL